MEPIFRVVTERQWERPALLFAAVVGFIWLTATWRLFYVAGSAEHDAFMMAAAIVHGWHVNESLNILSYGADLQFLFYEGFHKFDGVLGASTERVLFVLNSIGALCFLGIPLLLSILFTKLSGDATHARWAVLFFLISPLYWMLASYGHPFHVAWFVSLLACLSFLKSEAASTSRAIFAWLAMAVTLQTIAMAIRMEQVALFSVMVVGSFLISRKVDSRRLFHGAVFFAAPLLFFLLWRGAIIDPIATQHASATLAARIGLFLLGLDPTLVRWSAARFVTEAGAATLLLAFAGCIYAIRAKKWAMFGTAVLLIVPSLAVYAGNPSPPRHFILAGLGVAYLAAVAAGNASPLKRSALIVIALLLNFVAPWALVPVYSVLGLERPDVSYNVLERRDRNVSQIIASQGLQAELFNSLAHHPVALFAPWVLVSQFAAFSANDPTASVKTVRTPSGVKILVISTSTRRDMHLIESYEAREALDGAQELRKMFPGIKFVAAGVNDTQLNDLKVQLPPELYWWSS